MLRKMIASIPLLVTACASVDYALPPGTPTAPLTVSTNMKEMKNIHVRYQGANSCANYPGKTMGILNSVTIGVKGGNPIEVNVPTGAGIQVVSIMGAVPTDVGMFDVLFKAQRDQVARDYLASLREPYFAFEPKDGYRYLLQFDFTGSDIKLIGFEQPQSGQKTPLESLPLPDNCKDNEISRQKRAAQQRVPANGLASLGLG